MKKSVLLGVMGLVLASVAAIGVYAYTSRPTANKSVDTSAEVFRRFVEKGVGSSYVAARNDHSSGGSRVVSVGYVDVAAKQFVQNADIECSGEVDGKSVDVSATYRVENAAAYMRLNNIKGEVTAEGGETRDLAAVFAKVKGTWYQMSDNDESIKAQLDNGVFVFRTQLIAPRSDTTRVADALIRKGAFAYTASKQQGDKHVFAFTVKREAYLAVIKEQFPRLERTDAIVGALFGDAKSLDNTLTVKRDGSLVTEAGSEPNACRFIMDRYVQLPEGLPAHISGTSTYQPKGSIKLQPITDAKPLAESTNDLAL